MTFHNLEKRVTELGLEEEYLELFDKLKLPTKHALAYLLDIGALLEENGLKNSYAVFGGYAVLTQLMRVLGPKIALAWRGSEDIDLYGTERIVGALNGEYKVVSDNASPNIAKKRTIRLLTREANPEPELKVDFSTRVHDYAINEIDIMGVPLSVVSPLSLVKGKTHLAVKDEKHLTDVLNLLWILEHDNVSPETTYFGFNQKQRKELKEVVIKGREMCKPQRIGFTPSMKYLSDIKKNLDHYGGQE